MVLLACAFGGLAAATWAGVIGRIQWENFNQLWFVFWVGDCTGMLVVTPLIVSWWFTRHEKLDEARRVEGALALMVGTLITLMVFASPPNDVFMDSTPS